MRAAREHFSEMDLVRSSLWPLWLAMGRLCELGIHRSTVTRESSGRPKRPPSKPSSSQSLFHKRDGDIAPAVKAFETRRRVSGASRFLDPKFNHRQELMYPYLVVLNLDQ